MGRIIIAGVETVAGQAIARRVSRSHTVEAFSCTAAVTSGLYASEPFAASRLSDIPSIDVVCFCGGASHSSWDADFGLFDAEHTALAECVEIANAASARLVKRASRRTPAPPAQPEVPLRAGADAPNPPRSATPTRVGGRSYPHRLVQPLRILTAEADSASTPSARPRPAGSGLARIVSPATARDAEAPRLSRQTV